MPDEDEGQRWVDVLALLALTPGSAKLYMYTEDVTGAKRSQVRV